MPLVFELRDLPAFLIEFDPLLRGLERLRVLLELVARRLIIRDRQLQRFPLIQLRRQRRLLRRGPARLLDLERSLLRFRLDLRARRVLLLALEFREFTLERERLLLALFLILRLLGFELRGSASPR